MNEMKIKIKIKMFEITFSNYQLNIELIDRKQWKS